MIEVNIDSVRISLMTQNRIVVLREINSQRYLPIWIGAPEADAITLRLQGIHVDRPLTHDLLYHTISALGADVEYVVVNKLKNDIFYAEIVLDVHENELRIDSRPSDALALAVRAEVPIYVTEKVMAEAGRVPEKEVSPDAILGTQPEDESLDVDIEEVEVEDLGAFADFIEGLDLDDLSRE